MTYDARGQLRTATVDGKTTQYFYDPSGRLVMSIDARQGETRYGYDGLGRLLVSTNALGQSTLTSYDAAGNSIAMRLANGLSTTSTYDRAGRLTSQIQSAGGQPNLGTTRYTWDAANRLVMTTDPTGARSFILYDSQGRKVADIDGDGSLTEYRYDAADRVSRTIQYAAPVNLAQLVDGRNQRRGTARGHRCGEPVPGSRDGRRSERFGRKCVCDAHTIDRCADQPPRDAHCSATVTRQPSQSPDCGNAEWRAEPRGGATCVC
jgi:YD repeat-containing protein